MRIKVTITSDFLCPWCYLGEVRFAKAVASLGLEQVVDLEWKPFELNPEMPAGGLDRQLYRTRKFGARIADQKDLELTELGREEGLRFNFAAINRASNTRLAHRLQRFAAERGYGTEYSREVFRAYFDQGQDIGEVNVLLDIIGRLGMDAGEASCYLKTGGGEAEVLADEAEAARLRVHAVPQFRIGEKVINGAQSVGALREVLLAVMHDQHAS